MAVASPSVSERRRDVVEPPAAAPEVALAAQAADAVRVRLRAALLSLVVSCALLVVKYVAYLATGSAAILSDALESIINVVAAIFAAAGLRFASRPADRNHPYGHGKMEYFSAVFEGGLIAFAAVLIVAYAIRDLVRGPELKDLEYGLVLTTGAGLVNALLGWYLLRVGRKHRSIALVADGKHVLSDFQTSIGVIVGLALVHLTSKAWFDPLAALLVGSNLCLTGYRLVREAAGGLLDEEEPELLSRLVRALEEARFPGIIRIHRLRAIRSGRETHADAHVIVPEYWSVEHAHGQVGELERRVLATPAIDGEIVFHVDPCMRAYCAMCDVPDCPVRQQPFVERPPLGVAEATAWDAPAVPAPSADARR
ncbi:MAG: cation diffusion facilitator family transporter [Thermodesulfobacteriota bacterium]